MLRISIHHGHPQPRAIARAVAALRAGALVILPTDTTYGLGCDLFARRSTPRIYAAKGLAPSHRLSLLCADLAEVARFGVLEDPAFRILRATTPGRYTFILPATRETPRHLPGAPRTVGVRIPDNRVCQALLAELGHPIVTTTATRPFHPPDTIPSDPAALAHDFARHAELILDAGPLVGKPSSVIDLTGPEPVVLRRGSGDLGFLEPVRRPRAVVRRPGPHSHEHPL